MARTALHALTFGSPAEPYIASAGVMLVEARSRRRVLPISCHPRVKPRLSALHHGADVYRFMAPLLIHQLLAQGRKVPSLAILILQPTG